MLPVSLLCLDLLFEEVGEIYAVKLETKLFCFCEMEIVVRKLLCEGEVNVVIDKLKL